MKLNELKAAVYELAATYYYGTSISSTTELKTVLDAANVNYQRLDRKASWESLHERFTMLLANREALSEQYDEPLEPTPAPKSMPTPVPAIEPVPAPLFFEVDDDPTDISLAELEETDAHYGSILSTPVDPYTVPLPLLQPLQRFLVMLVAMIGLLVASPVLTIDAGRWCGTRYFSTRDALIRQYEVIRHRVHEWWLTARFWWRVGKALVMA